jgi:hypothetical protein
VGRRARETRRFSDLGEGQRWTIETEQVEQLQGFRQA